LNNHQDNSPLCIYAGENAIAHIKSRGLSASDIKIVAGAAGGPKWLVLHGLDQFLFGNWLPKSENPIHLIGSSIGAWRYAAYCRTDFRQSFENFEAAYFAQRYKKKNDKAEVSEQLDIILDCIFKDNGIDEILNNQHFKLNLFADRGRGLLNYENPLLLATGLVLCAAANYFSRSSLDLFFRRTLFYNPDTQPPFFNMQDFPTDKVALSRENIRRAILASGAIPLIVNGVNQIPGSAPGYYRDGGLIDYHMSIPFAINEGLVLMPHFSKKVIPGWLDKGNARRKPDRLNMRHVLLLAPSESFINSLPLSKIPDRSDFKRFANNDEQRIKYWQEVTRRSEEIPKTLQLWMKEGSLVDHIQRFE